MYTLLVLSNILIVLMSFTNLKSKSYNIYSDIRSRFVIHSFSVTVKVTPMIMTSLSKEVDFNIICFLGSDGHAISPFHDIPLFANDEVSILYFFW